MIHWLEQTLLGSAMFSAGALYQWYMQRGTCRSCRIRYSFRRMLQPIAEKMLRRVGPSQQAKLLMPIMGVLEVALAFAFWDTMKIGWHLAVMPYMQQRFRRENKRS